MTRLAKSGPRPPERLLVEKGVREVGVNGLQGFRFAKRLSPKDVQGRYREWLHICSMHSDFGRKGYLGPVRVARELVRM